MGLKSSSRAGKPSPAYGWSEVREHIQSVLAGGRPCPQGPGTSKPVKDKGGLSEPLK